MEKILILLDDDSVGNKVNKKMLSKYFQDHSIIVFEDPVKALGYFSSMDRSLLALSEFTMFLDCKMPSLTGFEFLEELGYVQEKLRISKLVMNLKVYLLTSEDSVFIKEKIKVFPMIKEFLSKPLTMKNIQFLAS